jgi:hypothetical protein
MLSQQRPDIRERRQPRPGLREHRREQAAQLALKSVQPGTIFYDGTGGHLLILSRHKSMIMRWPSRIAAPGNTRIAPKYRVKQRLPCVEGQTAQAGIGDLRGPPSG